MTSSARILGLIVTVSAATLTPDAATAQVGSTTDIIMGRVVGPDSQPLVGARIEAMSVETQVTRRRTTNEDGRYTIVFPDGGGSYRVRVTYLGMAPAQTTVTRQGEEDRLVANFTLSRVATQLAAVEVTARQREPQIPRPEAGSTERGLPAGLVNRLPVDGGDLNSLATLAPGVIGIPGTDSTRASFSVAGQPPDQNSITLDGLSFGSGSVPQEAVRGTRVVTNTYDVARGQFTGGQVMSTTRGGTNTFQGALNYSMRDPSLEFVDEASLAQRYRQNQISAGFGGPIVRDKLFAFGAFQWNRRTDEALSLVNIDPVTLGRLGTSEDSVARFLSLLDTYGVPPRLAAPAGDRTNDNGSLLLRVDYNLGDDHTLMLRGDYRRSNQDPSRVSPLSVPHTGGENSSAGLGAMATLTSHFGTYINELRAYASRENRDITSYIQIPDGRVTVASTLEDGTRSISTLQFGGNPSLPQETQTTLIEASDEISMVSARGGHRFKLGGLINEERSSVGFIPNRFGTFTFNSLADFAANRPARFTRTLFARDDESVTRNVALYLGDSWRRNRALQLTYGVRVEGSSYPSTPAYNPLVDTLFARRTDRFPGDFQITPRFGFNYSRFPETGGPAVVTIRGGIGAYRGRAAPQLFSTARNATGLDEGEASLTCVGSTVPTPDWAAYLANPASIPTSCVGDAPVFGSQRRSVTVFDPDFEAPRAWRGSLGLTRRLFDRFNWTTEISYARGVAQTGIRDINLDTVPEFALATEGGRPVYVPATTIVPGTGNTNIAGSRKHSQFGRVSEVMSEMESDTRQLMTSFNGFLWRGAQINLSYTYSHARDQSQGFSAPSGGLSFIGGGFGGGFGGSGGTTAGNPNRAEWGRNDIARRHSILATITYPVKPWLDVSLIGRFLSGARYSPIVGGDVNGDGARNDRAFIFDPAATSDTAIANGMSRLLATAPDDALECLQRQLGTIASRNSCATPWYPSLDAQFNFRPSAFGLNRRLTVSVLALNTLAGLDRLLHGSDDLRGWGQPISPDRTLMYVRGFNPTTREFRYEVNENFGNTRGTRGAFRVPFQLAVQGRLAVGPDPARAQLQRIVGGPGGQRQTPEQLRARMAQAVPNVFRNILEVADSAQLNLTDVQKQQLTVAGDSLQAKADTLIGSIANILGNADRNAEPMRIGQQMQSRVREGRELATRALRDAQRILTPEQWAKLPDRVRRPFQGRGGQGGPGMQIFMGGPPQ